MSDSDADPRQRFQDAYDGKAPWDIGEPQPGFVGAAEQVAGPLLDCGCGTGENALFFAARGLEVTGIDFVAAAIERAKQKAAERGVAANFLVQDALKLPELGRTFASVIDSGLFHVFDDRDRARYVAGLAAVVQPGGRYFLMCFSDAEPAGIGPRRISQDELQTAFADGWAIESIEPARFQVIPQFAAEFSPGGPRAWFVVVRRED